MKVGIFVFLKHHGMKAYVTFMKIRGSRGEKWGLLTVMKINVEGEKCCLLDCHTCTHIRYISKIFCHATNHLEFLSQ